MRKGRWAKVGAPGRTPNPGGFPDIGVILGKSFWNEQISLDGLPPLSTGTAQGLVVYGFCYGGLLKVVS